MSSLPAFLSQASEAKIASWSIDVPYCSHEMTLRSSAV